MAMGDYRRSIGTGDNRKLCWVVAFDPGETTGWTAMGIEPHWLSDAANPNGLQDCISHIDYGQIDCIAGGGFDDQMNKHAGIAFGAEALGVARMVDITMRYPNAAIVLEDFIIDFSKIDQARHTLSPVRIMSMFSYAMIIENETHLDSKVFIQHRSLAKTTCTDARLRNWGLFESRGGRHARDATRHAFYFLRSCRGPEPKKAERRWRAWPDKFDDPFLRNNDGSIATTTRKSSQKKTGERVRFL